MKKIVCDKCEEEMGFPSSEVRIKDPNIRGILRDIDLCFDCTITLLNWLKEKPNHE